MTPGGEGQAAQAIVEFAISSGKPFAVVPCCVYSSESQVPPMSTPPNLRSLHISTPHPNVARVHTGGAWLSEPKCYQSAHWREVTRGVVLNRQFRTRRLPGSGKRVTDYASLVEFLSAGRPGVQVAPAPTRASCSTCAPTCAPHEHPVSVACGAQKAHCGGGTLAG